MFECLVPDGGFFWEGLGGVAFWKRHVAENDSEVSEAQARPALHQLPMDQDVKLSATVSVPCLSSPHHGDNGLIL